MAVDPDNQQWYPIPDQEQQDIVERQEHDLVASLPVLQDVLDWFDERIKTYGNPMTIEGVNVSSNAEEVKQAVLFAQSLIADYQKQREDFENNFSKYLKDADAA